MSRLGAITRLVFVLALGAALSHPVCAQHSAEDLAKKLANPVAALISMPFQLNYDQNIGPDDEGERFTLNIQPVIPFSLTEKWNLITRTILSVIHQHEISPGTGSQFGIGDTVQSLFFSPKAPTSGGIIWGVGPVFLIPTGTGELLSARKWGVGPTGVVLKQAGPWTYGALANHVWSVGGDSDRQNISATFLQPFLSYTTKAAWTFSVVTESTYNWKGEQWSVPINVVAAKMTKIGSQLMSFGFSMRYWLEGPESGAQGLGFRLIVTLLFPR